MAERELLKELKVLVQIFKLLLGCEPTSFYIGEGEWLFCTYIVFLFFLYQVFPVSRYHYYWYNTLVLMNVGLLLISVYK